MILQNKIIILTICIILFPLITATLFKLTKASESFFVNLLLSFISCVVIIVVLDATGGSVVFDFIKSKDKTDEELVIYILRISAIYAIASLGGTPLISKAYEIVTGEKLDIKNKIDVLDKKIEEVQRQSDTTTKIAFTSDNSSNTIKESIIELLRVFNSSNNGTAAHLIPEEFKSIQSEALNLGFIKPIVDKDTLEIKFVLTPLGMEVISK